MKRILMLTAMFVYVASAESNYVSVVCNVPGSTVLFQERTPITITVTNHTQEQITFIHDVSRAYDTQIWIDLGNKEQFDHPPGFGLTDRKKWSKDVTIDKWPKDCRLNPGEIGTWTLSFPHMVDIVHYASSIGTTSITVRVEMGANEWASSATLPFSVDSSVGNEEYMKCCVAELEYFNKERGRIEKTPFFAIPIGGKTYLFNSSRLRICELADGQKPEFELPDGHKPERVLGGDQRTQYKLEDGQSFVSISFPGSKTKIRYNLQTSKPERNGIQQ